MTLFPLAGALWRSRIRVLQNKNRLLAQKPLEDYSPSGPGDSQSRLRLLSQLRRNPRPRVHQRLVTLVLAQVMLASRRGNKVSTPRVHGRCPATRTDSQVLWPILLHGRTHRKLPLLRPLLHPRLMPTRPSPRSTCKRNPPSRLRRLSRGSSTASLVNAAQ